MIRTLADKGGCHLVNHPIKKRGESNSILILAISGAQYPRQVREQKPVLTHCPDVVQYGQIVETDHCFLGWCPSGDNTGVLVTAPPHRIIIPLIWTISLELKPHLLHGGSFLFVTSLRKDIKCRKHTSQIYWFQVRARWTIQHKYSISYCSERVFPQIVKSSRSGEKDALKIYCDKAGKLAQACTPWHDSYKISVRVRIGVYVQPHQNIPNEN